MMGNHERLRRLGLALFIVCATLFFLGFVNEFYPVTHWLFWRYVGYWLGAGCWALACTSFGYRLLELLLGGTLRKSEQLTLAAPLGAFAFGLAIFLIGLVHGLNVVTFFLLPAAFVAFGARSLLNDFRRIRRHVRFGPQVTVNPWVLPALVFATVALGLLYIQTLHPLGFTFDARWYHMTMAQRYALSGKVWAFPEGFWNAAWPHLFTYEYTWVFLAPLPLIFDRLELCQHLEVMSFALTLAQVPIVVRRLVPGTRVALTWIVFLLFPGLYLYDSNLNGGADHFAAFFALPIALTFWRAFRHFRAANVAVFAVLAAAAVMVKYTAVPLAVIPAFALLLRGLWVAVKNRDPRALGSVGALIGLSLLFTAPNWLANIIWYGDPMYPMLHKYLHLHPWVADTPSQLKFLHGTSRPGELTGAGLRDALRATVTFSFVPNDWYILHRDVPLFGSLFTLTIPCLVFLRGARRVAWLHGMAMAAVCLWYLISHYDRYLQASMPWMVAATACTLAMIWRLGGWARYAAVPLVALQIIWGSDAAFIATHNQVGDSPLRYVAKFLASGFEQQRGRFRVFEPMPSIGEAVPKNAVLLTHDTIMILGTDRNWVSDLHQTRISYGVLVNPKAVHQMLKEVGVTHLAWPDASINRDTVAGDLAFMNYAINYTTQQRSVANFTVAALPALAPDDARADYDVAYFSCGSPYSSGLYRLSQLRLPVIDPGRPPKPRERLPEVNEALARADMLVIDRRCHGNVRPDAAFKLATRRGESELWVRLRN